MFKKILVPLDGSEASLGILPHVSCLAQRLDIPVVLMAAIDPGNLEIPEDLPDVDSCSYDGGGPLVSFAGGQRFRAAPDRPRPRGTPSITTQCHDPSAIQRVEDTKKEVKAWLSRLITQLGQRGVRAGAVVSAGERPAEEILRLAAEYRCDLIAMATQNRNLLGQAIKGSVTHQVVRSSPVPVLAVTPKKEQVLSGQPVTISRLLVPLDGSPFAEAVLPYAEHLAEKLSLEVLLVRVLEIRDVYPIPVGAYGPLSPGTVELYIQAEGAAEEGVKQYLQDVAAKLGNRGLNIRWEVLRGGAARSIAELAQATPRNMIALASHGRSGIARWVMGSVTEELLRATGDPVLVIPSALVDQG